MIKSGSGKIWDAKMQRHDSLASYCSQMAELDSPHSLESDGYVPSTVVAFSLDNLSGSESDGYAQVTVTMMTAE